MRKYSVREIINKLRWHPDFDFSKVKIKYIDRPKGYGEVSGDEILSIGSMFLYLQSGVAIPHHRIVEIRYGDEVVWKKR